MKIIYLSYTYWPPDFGGDLVKSLDRFESLASRGHEILVLTSGKTGYPKNSVERGYNILRSPVVGESRWQRGLRRIIFWLWGMFQLIHQKYDVLHLGASSGFGRPSSSIMTWAFALIARIKKARRIRFHTLADLDDVALNLNGLNRLWYSLFFSNLSYIVAVSPKLYESLHAFAPEKSVLLLNGVRDDIFKPLTDCERQQIRQRQGTPSNSVIFVFLGTVSHRKGFDLLAKAFAKLVPSHPDWRLWVFGPYRTAESQNLVENEVKQVTESLNNVMDQVKFWGRMDDQEELAQLMGAGDVFVFPSRREGFGRAPVEAMAAGIPVIIARIPGITDLASIEGKTGLYIDPGSVEDLTQAMLQLGENAELRRLMGKAARARVVESFGWQDFVSATERLYAEGLSAK